MAGPHSSHAEHEPHDHDLGLAADLSRLSALLNRRRALGVLAGAGLVGLVGCGSSTNSGASSSTSKAAAGASTDSTAAASSTAAAAAGCAPIPEETAGPYPGDGSNGPDALAQSGIVRSDIRSSFGSASGVAQGVPLTINLMVVDASNGCAAMRGAAVYLWHCDRDGQYSMYSQSVANENYLRGVQQTDGSGNVSFTSIFPAAYSGRWPHVHFEVYPSLDQAVSGSGKIATSQLALPQDVCQKVYATDGYTTSVRNLAQTSLARDMVFSDGWTTQLATVTGDLTTGLTANLTVPV